MCNFIVMMSFCCFIVGGLLISSQIYGLVSATPTFVVSFQSSGGWSTDEWVEYDGKIPRLEKFTACHWEKLRHFSSDIMTVWSYCIADRIDNANMECTQLYYSGDSTSSSQQVILSGWVGENHGLLNVVIESYRHRSWNHICWSYSSITGINKFYYNGLVVGNISMDSARVLKSTDDSTIASFIIGQEPDIFNGEFDPGQLFNGEISELNLWDTVLNDSDIMNMAQCKDWAKGTVLSWEKSSIKNHGALIIEQDDAELFCMQQRTLVIFPQRQPLPIAKDLCASHGGDIIVPVSDEDNSEMMSILHKHKDICMETIPTNIANTGKGTWLGLSKAHSIWYRLDNEGMKQNINFSNWDNKQADTLIPTDCTYSKKDGKWSFSYPEACFNLELCTICSIIGNPVFTVNGICGSTVFDYNYYLITDENHTVHYYEGYKSTNIIHSNNKWTFVTKNGNGTRSSIEYDIGKELTFPMGRRQWEMYDPKCGIWKAQWNPLSLSKCKFGKQFTCNSGTCIDLQKRCNQNIDCGDGSDEEGCKLIHLPATYRKIQPPEPVDDSKPLDIITSIKIISIDTIDTINMKVGLTLRIKMMWLDSRLKFANLMRGSKNMVRYGTVDELWIPLDYVTHENAVIGDIFQDDKTDVELKSLSTPMPMDPNDATQDTFYSGTNTFMEVTQSYRIMYKCIFALRKFPFDRQNCTFIMTMESDKQSNVSFAKYDPAIEYDGPEIVKEFEIAQITTYTGMTKTRTVFKFTVIMQRMYITQIISAFFPTCLLWLLAYFTLFIKIDDFNERIMVSVTVLLVLAALLSSINASLPETSYFKYIDLWFLWYTVNIFLITVFHMILKEINFNTTRELRIRKQVGTNDDMTIKKAIEESKKRRINDMAKNIFLIAFLVFNVVYFPLQI